MCTNSSGDLGGPLGVTWGLVFLRKGPPERKATFRKQGKPKQNVHKNGSGFGRGS